MVFLDFEFTTITFLALIFAHNFKDTKNFIKWQKKEKNNSTN